jgi:hypothetical protein
MSLLLPRAIGVMLILVLGTVAARAEEAEIWSTDLTSSWLNDNISVKRYKPRTRTPYNLNRTQVWANGLARNAAQGFQPSAADQSVGAKLLLLHDYNFLLGTELVRGGNHGSLSSKATWEAFVTQDWKGLGGATFGLSTAGFVDIASSGYSQSISGTMAIPLDLPLQAWSTQVRLSPNLNLDASSGDFSTGLMSEVMSQTHLSGPTDRFTSVLNVTLGYGIAPSTRPTASARVELRITPNL